MHDSYSYSCTCVNPISHDMKQDPLSHGVGGGYYDHGLKMIFFDRFFDISGPSMQKDLSLALKLWP